MPTQAWACHPGRLAEVALIFAVFFIQGAYPVPDVNEPYYLGKAIHFWNPDWIPGDFFLETADTHAVFYFTFGWLSLWLSPPVLAWFGRLLTWVLLAWAWRRLSFAVVPRRWFSVLGAAVLVCLIERCHMAGEWIIGGVEAKGFAFVLVFLALEALVRDLWNRAWLLLGFAAALHVLVGGWSAVAAGVAWLMLGGDRPALRSMWPGLAAGFALSLPGLVPSLILNWGVDAELVRTANQIYVYERLYHHLTLLQVPGVFVFRFVLLLALWLVLCRTTSAAGAATRRVRALVAGAVAIALAGAAISFAAPLDRPLAAGLLRFYWFRMADVAVPLGVALEVSSLIAVKLRRQPVAGRCWLAAATVIACLHVGIHAAGRLVAVPPRAYRLSPRVSDYVDWRLVCDWVAHSGEVPPQARFLTPRMAQTFKWYARRSEVANWKEIPQDAAAIVEWWRRIEEIHATGIHRPDRRWHDSLAQLDADPPRCAERLRQLGEEYGADYVLTVSRPRLPLEVVYPNRSHPNRSYVVYRLR